MEDINFSVEEGDIIALLGESGSGKSTLLRILAGFEMPDSGEIILENKTLVSSTTFIAPNKRNIGMVFQDYALFPNMTVQQNISFAFPKTKEGSFDAVQELLEIVEMSTYSSRYPHELSGGQQQRIAIARAIASSSSLLLLDEPFSSLDQSLKQQLRIEMKAILTKTKITSIIVTHDIQDALHLANKILIIQNGKSIQFGTPQELHSSPKTEYVAQLFGPIVKTALGIIRPWHIQADQKGETSVVVLSSKFIGREYQINVKCASHSFYFWSPITYKESENLQLRISKDHLISI